MQVAAPEMHDLIIVGAGPAGSAAAIRAAELMPESAHRILLLDRARFPRVKICGGGIVRRGDYLLRRLGVELHVPTASINATTFILPSRTVTISRPGMFRVVRREEFDHALLQSVESRGVEIRQATRVLDLQATGEGLVVSTEHETLRARVVIGADGANGMARKTVGAGRQCLPMAGLETFTSPAPAELTPRKRSTALFDFSCTGDGIQGYSWDFPAGSERFPLVNRGIIHTHLGGRSSRVSLKSYLVESLRRRDIDVDPEQVKGHPLHMYDPSLPCSGPHLLLAGDAIGVEPLLGEGISAALETGMLAAEAACRALRSGDYSFSGYTEQIRTSHRMRSIRLKRAIAERFYAGPPRWWVLLAAIGVSGGYLRTMQAWEDLRGVGGSSTVSS